LGGNKQLTPWPTPDSSVTLIESSFDRLSVACDEIVVVLGHRQIEIQDTLRPRAHAALRADADADMSRSIQMGLEFASRVRDVACVLLQLADHPEVASSTLESLLSEAGRRDVVVAPCHKGGHGHPIAIPPRCVREILDADLSHGLGQWFREDDSRRAFIEVDDPGVVLDVDTPEDLLGSTRY
jgi:molybdenum cofactor cytidylyltransferase